MRFRLRRGDTFLAQGQIFLDPITGHYRTAWARTGTTPQGPAGYVPANVTGFRIWMTAKYNRQDFDNQAVFEIDNMALTGITVVNPLAGTFTATAPPQATVSFPDGKVELKYDVQIKDTLARIFTADDGELDVYPDVTRATA